MDVFISTCGLSCVLVGRRIRAVHVRAFRCGTKKIDVQMDVTVDVEVEVEAQETQHVEIDVNHSISRSMLECMWKQHETKTTHIMSLKPM